ncbi:MAG: lytic transglycosylase domain-containing protein [Nonlabens sp.]
MKKWAWGLAITAASIISVGAIQSQHSENSVKHKVTESKDPEKGRVHDYNVYSYKIPSDLDFAGEKVPLENPDILERADREFLVNTYWQSNGILLIKRSEKFFPIIEPILEEEGIPEDFKYLAVIESGLQNVVSPAGARGFWQIMKNTGKELGLEVNDNVDERYHLEKATRAACQYLKESKERLGSWTLAAAAYNAGNAGVSKQLDRQQVADYYDLLLGEETGRYMFRIIAIKEILSNPESFGFNVEDEHKYQHIPTKPEVVDYEIDDLAAFAKARNINYKILKIHNPWLREVQLNNKSHKRYEIDIPVTGYYK